MTRIGTSLAARTRATTLGTTLVATLVALAVGVTVAACNRSPSSSGSVKSSPSAAEPSAAEPAPAESTPPASARSADRASAERAAPSAAASTRDDNGRATCALPALPTRYPAPPRIVGIGDLHGDMGAARAALRLAGAIDKRDRWIGGDLVVVQTGDILDRGDDEQAILDLFERLRGEAAAAGGAVHVLNGNHELMNAALEFSYVTPGGFTDFEDAPGVADAIANAAPKLAAVPDEARARVAAFRPGGPYARLLAGHNTAIVVGDTAFVHGGVRPKHAAYGLERLNRQVRCWLAGQGPAPAIIDDPNSPVWTRAFSMPPEDCDALERALSTLGATRMVVGHTPQMSGVTSACGDKVWRIDVGLADHYGGPRQVIEIRGDKVRVLK